MMLRFYAPSSPNSNKSHTTKVTVKTLTGHLIMNSLINMWRHRINILRANDLSLRLRNLSFMFSWVGYSYFVHGLSCGAFIFHSHSLLSHQNNLFDQKSLSWSSLYLKWRTGVGLSFFLHLRGCMLCCLVYRGIVSNHTSISILADFDAPSYHSPLRGRLINT